MKRTTKTAAAALIIAAVGAGGVAGCHALYGSAGGGGSAPGTEALRELAGGEAGVKAIAAQTQVAEKQVQKALPHSDVKGQAYLEAASDAHAVTLATTGHVEAALDAARQQVGTLQEQVKDALAAVQREHEKFLALEARWFVVWGERLERWLWTAAISWLLFSIGSALLGIGNPVSWIGRIKDAVVAWRVAMPAHMPAATQA